MPQLPQIVRERLKASPPAGIHPDANVLTAFVERSLPQSESAVVLDHLARCGDCRDVVALALPVSEVADVASARTLPSGWFGWPSLRWGLVAAGIVAVASVGIQQFVHPRGNVTVSQSDASTPRAQSQPLAPPAMPGKEGALKSPAAVMGDLPATAESTNLRKFSRGDRAEAADASAGVASGAAFAGPRTNSKMAMAETPGDLPFAKGSRKSMSAVLAKQAPAPALSRQVPPPATEMVKVQRQSSQVEVQSQRSPSTTQIEPLSPDLSLQGRNVVQLQPAGKGDVVERAKPPVATPAAPSATPSSTARWTISPTGGLQRSLDGGNTWQEVAVAARPEPLASFTTVESVAQAPADKTDRARNREDKKSPTTISNPMFRAVAADGLEVWAGGSGGMLYHSNDGGEHWTRVLPSADGVVLRGNITSIQFSDPQQGKVSTSSPEVWMTNDGGQSWQKQ